MNKQLPPTMAPDRPLITVAVAMVLLLGLFLLATRPPGALTGATAQSAAEHQNGNAAQDSAPPASGEPDELTVVDPDAVDGLSEAAVDHDGDISTEVSYPVIPNAEPLSAYLNEALGTELWAFEAASNDPSSYETEWNLTAANDGMVGVRLVGTETDDEGSRERYATYWYDTEDGQVYESSFLLAGQAGLDDLNEMVREEVEDAADQSIMHPISALYDSVGFNPEGDLVVEFDAGDVAPDEEGRMHAVIDRDGAEPLLSDLGLRVRDAATVGVEEFSVPEPPEREGDEQPGPPEQPDAPGTIPPVDEDVDCSDSETKCVALTYDDGPGGGTPELLDTLAEYDARATFFVTGAPMTENPYTVRRTYAEGHELANHTLDHPDLTGLDPGSARTNLDTVQGMVHRETGYTMDLMRPPYGATDDGVASVTAELGLAQILWSADTSDWRDWDASKVADRAIDGAEDGAIILMHDIHDTTITASNEIIPELDAQGYTMVTVSQLLGSTEPGESYHNGVPEDDGDEGSGEGEESSEDDALVRE